MDGCSLCQGGGLYWTAVTLHVYMCDGVFYGWRWTSNYLLPVYQLPVSFAFFFLQVEMLLPQVSWSWHTHTRYLLVNTINVGECVQTNDRKRADLSLCQLVHLFQVMLIGSGQKEAHGGRTDRRATRCPVPMWINCALSHYPTQVSLFFFSWASQWGLWFSACGDRNGAPV